MEVLPDLPYLVRFLVKNRGGGESKIGEARILWGFGGFIGVVENQKKQGFGGFFKGKREF